MAGVPYTGIPDTQAPSTSPSVFQTPVSVATPVGAFGERTGAAIEGLQKPLHDISDLYGKVAADDASNKYQEGVNKILYGDPSAKGPDGKPDTGYMGLKGDAALQAREDVVKRMESLRTELKSGLYTLKADVDFDNTSRRYKAITDAQVGNHARTQANVFATSVNTATAKLALDDLARNADDPVKAAHAESDLIGAYMKNAELAGGGPELTREAYARGRRDALTTRMDIIAVQDPAKAMRMLEANKGIVGAHYDNLAGKYRARADQQTGMETADRILAPAAGAVSSESVKSAIIGQESGGRHFDADGKVLTSVDGAKGAGQITEGTFRQFAKPGERIDNEKDNLAVSNRIVDHYYQKYGGDIRRVAVAYFSGEGNVAGPDNATPWISNSKDGNGKSVAGYVADVVTRAGGRPSIANQADAMIQVMKDPELQDRPHAQAAALHRINQSYSIYNTQQAKRESEFKQKVDDSRAEALHTGTTAMPISREQFVSQYGDVKGPVEYENYASDVTFGADYKAMQDMSDAEQTQFLNARLPQPGAPGYDHAIKNQERLQKGVEAIQKQRRDDPSGAVSRMLAVMDAYKTYDPKKPETFKAVADARLVAQERLGIEPEFRSPITKTEALKLTAPLRTMLPGDESKVLKDMGLTFQKMFGDQADEAFSYAIRAHKVDAEVAQQAASIVRKLRDGVPLVPADASALDGAKEQAAAGRAVTGRRAPASPRVIGNPDADTGFEGTPVIQPRNVPPAAIEFLLKNPDTADAFDKKYGAGRARQIREKYPVAPGLP